jgi:oligopeptide/dipeptide ABC transporter ATP-binding protein
MSILQLKQLKTQFPTEEGTVKAVDGVDLEIQEGEVVGLVGESGSGKSVLADSILRIVDPPGEITGGEVVFNGENLLDKSEEEMMDIRGANISIVFQDPMSSMTPTITVGEQIAESIRLHQNVDESVSLPVEIKRKILGASKNTESWKKAIDMLERVGIPDPSVRASSYPFQFSGGMRQRAVIAMALSCEPDLLIADEPTTALDVTIQAQILNELKNLQDEFDTSILFITHDLPVVAEISDRINVMYAGEIVEKAPTEVLFENPSHPYTQGLIASIPQIEDPSKEVLSIPGDVPELIDIPFACHFAPRCPEATEECFEVEPDFRALENTQHQAACLKRGHNEEHE